ncbi:NifB/NifX family molybdenum-iron cluster-binding protein [Xanthobacter versatilis]|uniref:NifB/NifX family molybdenum-iron cluster-binding protein n=1 Tax=Xanthobacter autotrophicus (strain ATCC BAA-1158 / Py2) TaxID=78245 RepID=UPI00372A495E
MKIAIPTGDWASVAGHAGKARRWFIYDLEGVVAGDALPAPARVELGKEEILHHFTDDRPHPLDGVALVVAGSAGDGFLRHMKKRGTDVLLTGESDPATALAKILAGEALPDQRFDVTTTLCKVRDLFSRH